jgi:hypothetical protein
MFESVWTIRENIKPRGPTCQPHGPNNGTAAPTTFGPRLLPCPPMASPAAPTHRPTHHFRRPRPLPRAAVKRSAPPHELSFSSSAHCRHCAVVPPSLSFHKMPSRSSSELSITASSSAPMPGAPLTSLPVPSATPPLHHCRSSLAEPCHHGQPAPVLFHPCRPHPKHRAAEYILPNRSDLASDHYSAFPPSLPHRRSPPM